MDDKMINAALEAVIADMGKAAKGFKSRKFAPKQQAQADGPTIENTMDKADDQPKAQEISAEELEACLDMK